MVLVASTEFDTSISLFPTLKFFKLSSFLIMSLTVDFQILYFNMMSVIRILFRNILHTFSFSSIDKTTFAFRHLKIWDKVFLTTDTVY